MRHLQPGEGGHVPVFGVVRGQERQGLGDDGAAPAPVCPEIEVIHMLTAIGCNRQKMPQEVWNQEAHPEVVKEIRAVTLEPTHIEVSVLPINFQRLTKSEKQRIQEICLVTLLLFQKFLARLLFSLELVPVDWGLYLILLPLITHF